MLLPVNMFRAQALFVLSQPLSQSPPLVLLLEKAVKVFLPGFCQGEGILLAVSNILLIKPCCLEETASRSKERETTLDELEEQIADCIGVTTKQSLR